MLSDGLIGGLAGGALALAGVWLQPKLAARHDKSTSAQNQLLTASVAWMDAVAFIAHLDPSEDLEVRNGRRRLTEAKFRLMMLGDSKIWTALDDLEAYPEFHATAEGRAAFRTVVQSLRNALREEAEALTSATIDALLLGAKEPTQ